MAERIRGITIEIGGDTSKLEKSLKSVNSEIKSTEKQLKDVEKLLKLDPTNTELLAKKQKLLKERVEETQKKLKTLKETQDEFIKNGGDVNSDGYMALEREIAATEQRLEKAKTETNAFSEAGAKLQAKLSKVSKTTGEIAEKTKVLSAAAGAVVAALGGLGLKAVTASDDLNTLAAQSGFTTAELQKFQYASDVIDVSSDTIISAAKKMKKNLTSTSTETKKAFETIGVATKNADGTFREATDIFYDCLNGLSQIGNETERDALAMQIFGKNADELAGIIDDGGAKLKSMGEEAESLGLILDQATLDNLNEINDQLDVTKAKFKAAFLDMGAKIAQILEPVITKVVNGLSKVVNWLVGLDEKTLKTIGTIAVVVATISPIFAIISKISGAVAALIPIVTTINAVLLANPIILIITAIVAAVTALTIVIVKNWDTIKAALQKAIAWVKDTFTSVKNWVNEKIFKPIGNFFIGIVNKIIEGINFLIRGMNKIQIKLPDWDILGGVAGKSFGVNIKEIGKIPMLAKGGIVSEGNAIVGERGPELLSVANGKAVVQPLNANSITSGIVNGLSPFMNNGGSSTINLVVDASTIAQVIYDPIQKIAKQRSVINYG